jgi:hypothetical protein
MTILIHQIPVSLGGVTLPWDSGAVVGMLEGGVFLSMIFILYEWKWASIPILPLYIFKIRSVSLIMIQTSMVGIVYYGNLCNIPHITSLIVSFPSGLFPHGSSAKPFSCWRFSYSFKYKPRLPLLNDYSCNTSYLISYCWHCAVTNRKIQSDNLVRFWTLDYWSVWCPFQTH